MKNQLKTNYRNITHCALLFSILGLATGFLRSVSEQSGLFDTEDILEIKLSGEMRQLLRDKSKDPVYYPLKLSYKSPMGEKVIIPVEVRTRGNFRRRLGNCTYLPLMIKFPKDGDHSDTIFRDQRKMKLVVPCKGEKYVLYEYLVYKIYNLVTPLSFRTRLVKIKLENKKDADSFLGFLLEEEDQLARRNKKNAIERYLKPQQIEQESFLEMAVFQYLIGNTDWSIQFLQNIKLFATDSSSSPTAVPYDFDHAGIVSPPYAKPAEALGLRSVRDRVYRGYCIEDLKRFESVISRFRDLKTEIYSIYTDNPMLDEKYVTKTIKFLDRFYEVINDPKLWHKEFAYPCDPHGSGNVVIRGLPDQ